MSYQVLARKWRPKTFREMVGQEHVLKALVNALDHNRLHHAYLFTGTRGVGKTTIARILAKCLNCDVGVSSEPCGQCGACESIAQGRFVDLIEVDAASRTKVEDTKEMLENVQYAPSTGRFKVYLIDEVHMLSTHSFNALLKTLEEPPPHVKFLLATTDPQKLPATILSRCLQFNLKNMTPESIVGHLHTVLEQEMVAFEEPALWQLGRAADGSMRDAMSLTDQAIAFGSGKLLEADVRAMLGSIDQTAIYDIIESLVTLDGSRVLAAVAQLSEHAPDYGLALEELLTLLHRMAIAQAVPGAVDNSLGDKDKVVHLASQLCAEDIQLFYQLGLNGRRDLPLAPDPRSGFEMVLLRMLAFKPSGVAEQPRQTLNNSVNSSEAPQPAKKPEAANSAASTVAASSDGQGDNRTGINDKAHTVDVTTQAGGSASMPPAEPSLMQQARPEQARSGLEQSEQAKREPVASPVLTTPKVPTPAEHKHQITADKLEPTVIPTKAPASHQPVPVSPVTTAPIATTASAVIDKPPLTLNTLTPQNWNAVFEQMGFGGVVGNIASHCVLDKIEGDNLYLLLDEANATLFSDSYAARIESHLSVTLNAPIKLHVSLQTLTVETPDGYKSRLQREQRQQALISLQQDPNIQTLVNDFSAVLDEKSVAPL